MRYSQVLAVLIGSLSLVNAFPKMTAKQLETLQNHAKKDASGCPFAAAKSFLGQKRDAVKRAFDPAAQKIDVTGAHAFVPPNLAAGDQRGPCPGLNALANHGFLPHNGVADIPTIINAVNEVYSMSLDLGSFLATYGTVFDGNPLSLDPGYSIGGPSSQSTNILGGLGLLGTPTGLSGSHNKYEADTSPTRGDLYLEGNNYKVFVDRFQKYYDALKDNTAAPQQYEALLPFRIATYQHSVQNNPYFFYSPFAGVLVSPAGYSFPPRMMANHSAEYPDGYLDKETFKSFFAITGQSGNFQYKEGWERIPDNWYKRPASDPYSIPGFLVDVADFGVKYPPLLNVGGNTGTPNSFAGVDLGDLTGGVFNEATLLQGNNLECFMFQIVQAAAPDVLGTTFSNVAQAMQPLTDFIQKTAANLACPQLAKIDEHLFDKYPGYKAAYNGYSGGVAV